MKIEEFAYQVAAHTIEQLEKTQHYKIPEETRKAVIAQVLGNVNDLIKKAK